MCHAGAQVSREPPPPIPGGYMAGAHELINAFEKNSYAEIPALMKHYYKLNQLHISQLRMYLKMCTPTESKILEHNKMYLLQLSQMFSKLLKGMHLNSKKECLSKSRTNE